MVVDESSLSSSLDGLPCRLPTDLRQSSFDKAVVPFTVLRALVALCMLRLSVVYCKTVSSLAVSSRDIEVSSWSASSKFDSSPRDPDYSSFTFALVSFCST